MKLIYNNKGSISILLIIILLPMLTLSGIIIDYARVTMAKSMVSSAGDLAMNAALANYDSVLQDVYGLFAMSQLSENPEEALHKNLKNYFETTLISNDIMSAGEASIFASELVNDLMAGEHSDFMEMDIISFSAKGVEASSLANPYILKKQIVEYMKYRGPLTISMSFLDGLDAFSKLGEQSKVTEAKLKVADDLGELQEANRKLYESIDAHDLAFDEYMNSKIDVNQKFSEIEALLTERNDSVNGCDTLIGNILIHDDTLKGNYISSYTGTHGTIISSNETAISHHITDVYNKYTGDASLIKKDDEYLGLLTALQNVSSNKEKISVYQAQIELSNNYISKCDNNIKHKEDLIESADPDKEADKIATLESEITELDSNITEVSNQIETLNELDEQYLNLVTKLDQTKKDAEGKLNLVIQKLDSISVVVVRIDNEIDAAETVLDNIEAVRSKLSEVNQSNDNFKAQIDDYDQSLSGSDSFSVSMKSDHQRTSGQVNESELDVLKKRVEANLVHFKLLRSNIEKSQYRNVSFFKWNDEVKLDSIESFIKVYKRGGTPVYQSGTPVYKLEYTEDDSTAVKPIKYLPTIPYYSYLQREFKTNTQIANEEEAKSVSTSIDNNNKKLAESWAEPTEATQNEETSTKDRTLKDIKQPALPIDINLEELPMENADAATSHDFNKSVNASGSFKHQAGVVQELLEGLGQITIDARDNFYVMEYAFNTFTCDTTGINPDSEDEVILNLANYQINDASNYLYRGEIEYLLYGKGSINENVRTAKTQIFAIRLVSNSIYAFTDGEIKAQTLGGATSISAATGGFVPIPLIQAVLQLSLAMAESVLDLTKLSEGEAVVLFKTRDTWTMSLTGMVSFGRETAKDFAETHTKKAIKNISERIRGLKDLAVDEVGKELNNIERDLIDDLKSRVISLMNSYFDLVSLEIEKSINSLFVDSNGNLIPATQYDGQDLEALINAKLDEALDNAYIKIVELFKVNAKDDSEFVNILTSVKEDINTHIKSKFQSLIDDFILDGNSLSDLDSINALLTKFSLGLTSYIDSYFDILDQKLKLLIKTQMMDISNDFDEFVDLKGDELEAKVSEYCSETIDKNFDKLDSKINTKDPILEKSDVNGHSLKTMISFKYDDYLRMFFYLKLIANEEETLKRIASLIQTNINSVGVYQNKTLMFNHQKGEGEHEIEGFEMSKAYTYLELESHISIKPLFIRMNYFDKFKSDNEGKNSLQTIQYKGLKGY